MLETIQTVNVPTIMIVEDNQEHRQELQAILDKNFNNFYNLAMLNDGKAAVDFFTKNIKAIKLIILNALLRQLDCDIAIARIKKIESWEDIKSPAHVPIIIVYDDCKINLDKLKDVSYDAGFEYPLVENKFLKEVEHCLQRK
ncbi:MAG: hypothetical protein V1765_03010 [bacterium]